MEPFVLLVKADTRQAELLVRAVARQRYAWNMRVAGSFAEARAALAAQAFDAIVSVHRLADGTAFEMLHSLPEASRPPLLIGIAPGEEAVAARALRQGVADYYVRDPDDRYLLTLPRQIDRMLQHRREQAASGQADARLARQNQLLQAISRAHSRFIKSAAPGAAFETMLADFLALTGSTFGFVAEVLTDENDAPYLQTLAITDISWDEASTKIYRDNAAQGLQLRQLDTLFGAALTSGQPVISNEPLHDARRGGLPQGHPALESFVGIPVRSQDELAAFVGLANRPGGFTDDDIDYLAPLSATLGNLVLARRVKGDRTAAETRMRESEARWRSISELSSDWFWEQDAEFRFVRIEGEEAREDWLGGTPMLGLRRWDNPALIVSESQWREHRAQLDAHQTFRNFEMEFTGRDQRRQWISVSGMPVFGPDGTFTGYRGTGHNITERKLAEARIESLAFFDDLTGLPNRRRLRDRLLEAQAESARLQRPGAVLLLDLDNFKDINDALGPERSDRLLQIVAQRLRGCAHSRDTVARLGGDEFAVLLEGLPADPAAAAAEAESVAATILLTLGQPYTVDEAAVVSTPSIGIVLFLDRQTKVDELLQHADLAMYQAKAAGRNTFCFFHPAMQERVTARHHLEAELRQALTRDGLRVAYQPVVDRDGRLTGVEALMRWPHPGRGMVSPAEFIPVAEQSGLIVPLGQFVLRTACEQLAAWKADPRTAHLSISINVSAREFRHPKFVAGVLTTLAEWGAATTRLKLEITESLLLYDMQDTITKMTELRSHGVGLSLDDFGTGYSSLSYLKRLPFDQLKIDQSFVSGIQVDPHDAAVACTIIQLARSFGMDVVAEGVETEGQRDFLVANGCGGFQGYLFGRPGPVEDLRSLLGA